MKKRIAIIAGVVIFIAGICIYMGKARVKSQNNQVSKELAQQLYDKNGQSYTIDDYTITLKETIFDSKANMGYLTFSYRRENTKPEIQMNGQGVDQRFYLDIPSTGARSYDFAYKGDVLYQYINFTAEDDYERDVFVLDVNNSEEKTQTGYKEYPFKIKETSKAKTFLYGDETECVISPIGICVKSSVEMENLQIIVVDKDNKRQEVISNCEDVTGSSFNEETEDGKIKQDYSYEKMFDQSMDVDHIAYVEFNGEKIFAQ